MYYTNLLENCIGLIERHAPRLMREGGGSLGGDKEMFIVTPAHVAEIIKLYHLGLKTTQIAEKIGCSKPTVSKYLRANGLKGRAPYNRTNVVTQAVIDRMMKLHSEGLNMTRISQKLGFSIPTVSKYVRMNTINNNVSGARSGANSSYAP